MVLDLDNIPTPPKWDFTVKVGGKVYSTRRVESDDLKSISAASSSEEISASLNKILEPAIDLADWDARHITFFFAAYLEYFKQWLPLYKAAMSLDWVAESIAAQMPAK